MKVLHPSLEAVSSVQSEELLSFVTMNRCLYIRLEIVNSKQEITSRIKLDMGAVGGEVVRAYSKYIRKATQEGQFPGL